MSLFRLCCKRRRGTYDVDHSILVFTGRPSSRDISSRLSGENEQSSSSAQGAEYPRSLSVNQSRLPFRRYGPPRTRPRCYERDRRYLFDSAVETDEEPDTIPEEELNKEVHVKSVDLHKGDNCERHHTDLFECTENAEFNGKQPHGELVVRRGEEFLVTIELDRPYDKQLHDLNIVFKTGERPLPSKGTFASCAPKEESEPISDNNTREWRVRLVTQDECCMTVAVYSPPTCPIGEWEMIIKSRVRAQTGNEEAVWYYECPDDIILLLNPWCKDDAVYLPDEELLKEYVLNDSGVCYQGNYNHITAKSWYYGQFDSEVLDAALFLLRKGLMFRSSAAMGDPVLIARALSKIVNSNDTEMGVITDSVEDCREVATLNGSVGILRQYMDDPTKLATHHGHCWVYANLLTTVCRAIGVPCRCVTCYGAAHEGNPSLSVSKVFVEDDNGEPVVPSYWMTDSSVWNFHTWNEVWTSRVDFNNTDYDGWQVVDTTPRHSINGVYRIGPAPVIAVKSGDVDIVFDTTTVFAEVNADIIHWKQTTTGELSATKCFTNEVGAELCTHKPTGQPYNGVTYSRRGLAEELEREIITNNYKHEEGSTEKMDAFEKATKIFDVTPNPCEINQQNSLEIAIQKCDDVIIGSNVTFSFAVTNRSEGTKLVGAVLMMTPTCYNGVLRDTVHKYRFDDVSISPDEEKMFTSCLDGQEALSKIGGSAVKVNAYAYIKGEATETVEDECDFMFHIPALIFKGPSRCERNDVINVDVSFVNPLNLSLTGCVLHMEGSLECVPPTTDPLLIQDIPGGERFETAMSFRARTSPRRKLVREICASLYCNELPVVHGKYNVELEL